MHDRNRESPWNPGEPLEITPEDYEKQVVAWLKQAASPLQDATVTHLDVVRGAGGEYEFDVVVRFTALGGAKLVVLSECKRHTNPVKRDVILAFAAKLEDVGAHKGIVFSTAGFQKGALEYASAHGIATVTFVDGRSTYITRAAGPPREPPPWVQLPRFAGHLMSFADERIHRHLVSVEHVDALKDWLL